ncbi:MAG: exosortase [Gammaproteobacteria bacterium]|uniref:Exosortase/archaeosortase family protein n=1 Tax=Candidatus Kutchimonas denitrificans TaxID=3056748 RepID=A0AAE5CBZ1_9BACT|nr:exosortase/archaeosortase family protein [Gemmatimonadota bacterium]NIR75153.1 exosortase/archaeosortase family protein [Candidatus Kutchimonas denitrificans]NIU52963.1 exosortase [Gemmatimonadota bacterium]NIV52432.1 exosortase [Gammaproteobacteria bacterium]NIY44852.1 exosortase [Gemmatimonadota bacterium]
MIDGNRPGIDSQLQWQRDVSRKSPAASRRTRLSQSTEARISRPDFAQLATALAFLVLFGEPIFTLVRDWWQVPEASHGLLLGPLAIGLAWRRGMIAGARPQARLGLVLLSGAIGIRYLSSLAAEPFTLRMSIFAAAAALVVFYFGLRQVLHWWLPAGLLILSVPIPEVILNTLALPLQLQASELGTALLDWRHVPVALAGNVILLPGRSLFVTEACSGLRSLTALTALGLLVGGLWLTTIWARVVLIAVSIPVAVALNAVRIFLTGFLVHFVNPELGDGLMHYSEGWVLFLVALALLALVAWGLRRLESLWRAKVGP